MNQTEFEAAIIAAITPVLAQYGVGTNGASFTYIAPQTPTTFSITPPIV
jgi:hypothetical protein